MHEVARMKMKLLMSAASLVIALVMMSLGTFAWMTVSTEAQVTGMTITTEAGKMWPFELSTDYDPAKGESAATWGQDLSVFHVNADDRTDPTNLRNLGPLRPITTHDGVYWYLPVYNAQGDVASFSQVTLGDVMNRVETVGAEEAGNYVISFSFWIRTLDSDATGDTAYALRLNNPRRNDDDTYHVHDDEELFGTFVLTNPTAAAGGTQAAADDGMACLRIGFKVEDNTLTDEGTFYIYEPNADKRSVFDTYSKYEQLKTLGYVHGPGTGAGTAVQDYDPAHSSVQTTYVPRFDTAAPNGYIMDEQPISARQQASTWKSGDLRQTDGVINSHDIETIGNFYRPGSTTEFISSYSELPYITTIQKGAPKKITVYLWLEGQDIDCWNQIAAGSIYGNLEFRGDLMSVPAS